jgi:hypothetical protein
MEHRIATFLMAVALTATVPQAQNSRLSHDGATIDAATGKNLAKVTASAYGSVSQTHDNACPTYDDFVDDAETTIDGTFTLQIPGSTKRYLVTYCHPDYVTFTRKENTNTANGTPIVPKPVRLFPRSGNRSQMRSAIERLRSDTRKAAISMRDMNAKAFTEALLTLPAAERELVAEWTDTGQTVQPKPASALEKLVDDFRSSLDYFNAANSSDFCHEVSQVKDVGAYAQKTILTTPCGGGDGPVRENAKASRAPEEVTPCRVAISDPRPGAQVHAREILVHGEARRPDRGYLWVLARHGGLRGWWPQGGGEADVSDDGQWKVLVTLGNPRELGTFEIVAVIVNEQSNEELKRWVVEAPHAGYPPTGFPTPVEGCAFRILAVEKVSD